MLTILLNLICVCVCLSVDNTLNLINSSNVRTLFYYTCSSDLASMDIEDGGAGLEYNPMDAQGFIRINAVRLRANYLIRSHGSK